MKQTNENSNLPTPASHFMFFLIFGLLRSLLAASLIAENANVAEPSAVATRAVLSKSNVVLEMIATWAGDHAQMRQVSKTFLESYDSSRLVLISELEPALLPSMETIKKTSGTKKLKALKDILFVKLFLQAKHKLLLHKKDLSRIQQLSGALDDLVTEFVASNNAIEHAKLFKRLHVLNRGLPKIVDVSLHIFNLLHWIAEGNFAHLSTAVLCSSNAKDILKSKADMNVLQSALSHGNFEFANLILDRFGSEALIAARDLKAQNSLHYAASSRNLQIVQRILGFVGSGRNEIVYRTDDTLLTPLDAAAISGDLEVFKAVLYAGSPSRICARSLSSSKPSVLLNAINAGHLEIVKFILNMPEFEFENKDPSSMLLSAFLCKNFNIYPYLVCHPKNTLNTMDCSRLLETVRRFEEKRRK